MKNKSSDDSKKQKFDPNANKDIKELTHKALKSYINDKINERASNKIDLDALSSEILEFLSCFILIGYNFSGEPVTVISAHNQQEADSLGALLNKFMYNNREKDLPGD
jgi:ribosome biogenesis protein Nip4